MIAKQIMASREVGIHTVRIVARRALAAVLVGGLAMSATAQTAALDDDDKLTLVLLFELGRSAQQECQGLESMKTFQAAKAKVEARLKAKHGLTVDQAVAQMGGAQAAK